jgi:hypothetical protein
MIDTITSAPDSRLCIGIRMGVVEGAPFSLPVCFLWDPIHALYSQGFDIKSGNLTGERFQAAGKSLANELRTVSACSHPRSRPS